MLFSFFLSSLFFSFQIRVYVNGGYGYNCSFEVCLSVYVFILGNGEVFDFDHIADFHVTDIYHNFVYQC